MSEGDLRPTVFVVMPYGVKTDPSSGMEIDFDDVWETAFRPAANRADIEPIRADEERISGFVHLAMFERLLLAEIVIADLTLASPNVMYELGIRHATRPRATISVFARTGNLPFDLSPIRALPYRLDAEGRLTDEARKGLLNALTARLEDALTDDAAVDSPLFQLIRSYPGVELAHDVTETFQQRVRTLTALSDEIRSASRAPRPQALHELRGLADKLVPMATTPSHLLIDLLLAFRDVEAYDEMVDLALCLPAQMREHPAVLQLTAFGLNRRSAPGDDEHAIRILERLIEEQGGNAETYGLLGRVHKDRHRRLIENDPFLAEAALEDAIEAYEKGFLADIRDYYPGVNAVTLLLLEGSEESYKRARELSPVVAFAIAARNGIRSRDYWDVASVLELAVVNLDAATARAAARRLLSIGGPAWRRRTTVENLQRLQDVHQRRGQAPPWLPDLIAKLMPGDERT